MLAPVEPSDLPAPYGEALRSIMRSIALADPDRRLEVFRERFSEALTWPSEVVRYPDLVDRFVDQAESTGLIKQVGMEAVNRAIAQAEPMRLPKGASVSTTIQALHVVAASSLHGQSVPRRAHHVEPLIPARTVTLLTGDGGTGKSLLALQLAASTALAAHWLGLPVEPGRVVYISAEDDLDELHRRLADIVQHHGRALSDLADLHLLPLAGDDAVMAAPNRSGIVEPTKLWARIVEVVADLKPALVIFDTLADAFGGDENHRAQARQFIGLLRGLAIKHSTTPLVLAHPSLTGIAAGDGRSGSTGWGNSVRSRLYLGRVQGDDKAESDPDLRVLRTTKANYARLGDEIRVRWQGGVFVRESAGSGSGLDRLAGQQAADDIFIDCLRLTLAQGRYVSGHPCSTYAPAIFAGMPQAKGYTAKALRAAMERLFTAARIKVDTKGPASKQRRFLTLSEGNE